MANVAHVWHMCEMGGGWQMCGKCVGGGGEVGKCVADVADVWHMCGRERGGWW